MQKLAEQKTEIWRRLADGPTVGRTVRIKLLRLVTIEFDHNRSLRCVGRETLDILNDIQWILSMSSFWLKIFKKYGR